MDLNISNDDLLYLLNNDIDYILDKDIFTSIYSKNADLKKKQIYCNNKLIVKIDQCYYGVDIRNIEKFPELCNLIHTDYYIYNEDFGKIKFLKLYCKIKEDRIK